MSLEGVRDLLSRSLASSLQALTEEDKLAAAWPVVCGVAMSQRGSVVGYADGVLRIEVADETWMRQMAGMRNRLARDLAKIAGVAVSEIHFERKRNDRR